MSATYLHCTGKILKEVKEFKNPESVDQNESLLGNWYVNRILIERRKAFVFMNENTLFSFVVFGIGSKEIFFLKEYFVSSLKHSFQSEGINTDLIEKVCSDYESIAICKTQSKSRLGNMNDLCYRYKDQILDCGGFGVVDIAEVIKNINRTPHNLLVPRQT